MSEENKNQFKSKKSVDDIKSLILRPSLTSLYRVNIDTSKIGGGAGSELNKRITEYVGIEKRLYYEGISLLCAEASLPGSKFMTHEISNDRTGISEFHPYRRMFDNKIELTFYVDGGDHLPIRFFEGWMQFISNEPKVDETFSPTRPYSMKFPKDYMCSSGFNIIKFEKGHENGPSLEYIFYNSFPLSINSMPVSYDTSAVLKCNVTMSYTRYIMIPSTRKKRSPNPETIAPDAGDANNGGGILPLN